MNNEFLMKLNESMMQDFVSVHPDKNPVARTLEALAPSQLEYVLGQYTLFPKKIVSFLQVARDKARIARCAEIAEELTRNMGEELGTETQGVTHYEMLAQGLGHEFGEVFGQRIRQTVASAATQGFVGGIEAALGHEELAYVLGAIYAVESSAVPELRIVKRVVDKLIAQVTDHQGIEDVSFQSFFDMHLGTWEPGHEEGLRVVSPSAIQGAAEEELFARGFKDVMVVMDAWWDGLSQESSRK